MQRHELLAALESFVDETDVQVCDASNLQVMNIRRVTYVPMNRDRPAFLCLIIDSTNSGSGGA